MTSVVSDMENTAPPPASRFGKHEHLIKYFLIGGTASAIDVALFLILFNIVGTSEYVAQWIAVPT